MTVLFDGVAVMFGLALVGWVLVTLVASRASKSTRRPAAGGF